MTDRGYDSSTGFGVRLGFMGKPTQNLTVGLSYAPKINMTEFDSYAGLFAGKGDFDIPANASIGLALQATLFPVVKIYEEGLKTPPLPR